MLKNYAQIKAILLSIGWPTDLLFIDFETYFNKNYTLNKLTTAEYIDDERFEVLGLALWRDTMDTPHFTREIPTAKEYFENHTIIGHNLIFDGAILTNVYGYNINFAVDTISLSRYFEARAKHNLDAVAARCGIDVEAKGDRLSSLSGLHWQDMTDEQQMQLQEYAIDDIYKTIGIFDELFPLIPNPHVEFPFMVNTLRRYWHPELIFDYDNAHELYDAMEHEINTGVEKVKHLCQKKSEPS